MYNSIGQLCHSSYYTFRRMHEQSIYDLRHKFMINIGHMHINMICYVCPTHWCTKIRVAINLDYVSNIATISEMWDLQLTNQIALFVHLYSNTNRVTTGNFYRYRDAT